MNTTAWVALRSLNINKRYSLVVVLSTLTIHEFELLFADSTDVINTFSISPLKSPSLYTWDINQW